MKIVNVIFILLFTTIITYDTLKKLIILIGSAITIHKRFEVLRDKQADNNRIIYNNVLRGIFIEIRNYLILQGVLIAAGFYNELWSK
jgi:hypothetical protein